MSKQISVYCTEGCPWCIKAKEYLKSKNISFRDINLSKEPKQAEEMFRRSGAMTVPQIWIGNRVIIGFDKDKIDQAISQS